MFTLSFIDDEFGGAGFLSGIPIFIVGFFVLIIGFILFGVISAASKGISTNSLTTQLREHAARLVSPVESDALNYVAYLESLRSFPVEKSNLEPFRIATGILKLVQGADEISETTKKQVLAQYLRLGILDADHLADEQPVRNHSHSHHHHH
ncbi:hypothetical protein ACV3PA_13630 [Exiguobacterium acetylicum]|uniref:hypothetical protein n=1 Tax=Exiguobacterium sp. BMC-KP TaxID=1684312 RepID=UPI0006AA2144|nr:hypothetical protein [Exiguobacterium sp. BMC-KP]KOP28697.1 hypothetical protein ADM98_07095 [Exiguobacterium sp. BMC-KP]